MLSYVLNLTANGEVILPSRAINMTNKSSRQLLSWQMIKEGIYELNAK